MTQDAFRRAATYLETEGRPLELARFKTCFEGANVSGVVRELRAFQNSDGGFGRALEPDLRTPESSALCTSIAFQIIREHRIPEDDDLVKRGIAYLEDTLDRDELHWRIIPRSAGKAPRAPWWNQEGREDEFRSFSMNPTAEILGYVLDYGGPFAKERVITGITDRVLDSLRSTERLEMHALLCCLRLLETNNLNPQVRDEIRTEIKRLIPGSVATAPETWNGYCLRPLQVVRNSDSPFMDGLQYVVCRNLDFEIEEQRNDGSWQPSWTWDNQHPEHWKIAKREWAGVLTLEKLRMLKRFGRLQSETGP